MTGSALFPIRLSGVSRAFGTVDVLHNLTFEVAYNGFVAIVGPSGCGKTTLLNLLSGYDAPTSGELQRHGRVRTVYQQDGLLPWLTVSENIALGVRHLPDARRRLELTREMLAFIRLEAFAGHFPHQLSGGMKQRVEIARALIGESHQASNEGDILLMDEPFSALDYLTRLRMRQELARMLHERPRTVVFVTHDIEEAAQLADRVFVLSERPARIQCALSLVTPRPRKTTDPEVVETVRKIIALMGLEENTDVDEERVYPQGTPIYTNSIPRS